MTAEPATPRRIRGAISWLLSPLLYIADDVVENYSRQAEPRWRPLDPWDPPPDDAVSRVVKGLAEVTQLQARQNSAASTESQSTSAPTNIRRQVRLQRGESFVDLGLVFEKIADAGLHVVSGVTNKGLAYGKIKVGDCLLSVDGVDLRNKSLPEIVRILSGPAGSRITFDVIETNALLSKDLETTLQRTPELPAVKRELRSRPDVGMSIERSRGAGHSPWESEAVSPPQRSVRADVLESMIPETSPRRRESSPISSVSKRDTSQQLRVPPINIRDDFPPRVDRSPTRKSSRPSSPMRKRDGRGDGEPVRLSSDRSSSKLSSPPSTSSISSQSPWSGSQQDLARETQSPATVQTIQALQDELSRLDARLHVASFQKKKSEQATRSPTRSPVDVALSADAAKVQKEIEDLRMKLQTTLTNSKSPSKVRGVAPADPSSQDSPMWC